MVSGRPLPKAEDPGHITENAAIDFVISDADMDALKKLKLVDAYGKFSIFPVFSGK